MQDNNRIIYALGGEIDHHKATAIRSEIDDLIMEERPKILTFDFTNVKFMDSSGIAVVINALRNMAKIDGKLELSGLQSQPMKVFRASGVDKLVTMKEEVR